MQKSWHYLPLDDMSQSSLSTSAVMAESSTEHKATETLSLHNIYRMAPQSSMQIASAHPMRISDITVWSATPIHITVSATSELATTAELGPDFACGWSNLSEQLKARILSTNLTVACAIDANDFQGATDDMPPAHKFYFDCLRATPEIAALAKQIFYGSNTFKVQPIQTAQTSGWRMAYPHPDVRTSISRLALQVDLLGKRWKFVREFADRVHEDFHNIKYVKVIFVNTPSAANGGKIWKDIWQTWRGFARTSVSFPCKGRYVLPSAENFGTRGFTELQCADLEPVLQHSLIFHLGVRAGRS